MIAAGGQATWRQMLLWLLLLLLLLPLGWFACRLKGCSQCDAAVGHEQLQRWQQEAKLLVCWQAVDCEAPRCKGCQVQLCSADAEVASLRCPHHANANACCQQGHGNHTSCCNTVAPARQAHTTKRQRQQGCGHCR